MEVTPKYIFFNPTPQLICLVGANLSYSVGQQACDVSTPTNINYVEDSSNTSSLPSTVSFTEDGGFTWFGNSVGEQTFNYTVFSNSVPIADRQITVLTKKWSSLQGWLEWVVADTQDNLQWTQWSPQYDLDTSTHQCQKRNITASVETSTTVVQALIGVSVISFKHLGSTIGIYRVVIIQCWI